MTSPVRPSSTDSVTRSNCKGDAEAQGLAEARAQAKTTQYWVVIQILTVIGLAFGLWAMAVGLVSIVASIVH